VIPANGVIV
jgi:hypothetical protein